MQTLDLSGRVALVTGASRGLGLSIAKRLLDAGASVLVTARQIDAASIEEMNAAKPDALRVLEGSLAEPDFARALVKDVFATYKRLDILVNNAGVMRAGLIGMISEADIDETLRVNLCSVIHLTQAAARLMSRTGGSIINISSIVGQKGVSGQFVYAASKAGVIGATLAASKELAPKNIRVNAIAPGYIVTKMTTDLGEDVHRDSVQRIGLGRAGQPQDVADVALFLASDMSRYVTGQVIGVDGGMVV